MTELLFFFFMFGVINLKSKMAYAYADGFFINTNWLRQQKCKEFNYPFRKINSIMTDFHNNVVKMQRWDLTSFSRLTTWFCLN